MPSGRTHDRITLWSLPWVAGAIFWQTQSAHLTLLFSGSFLVGGLMLGPDLDIYSRQYQRWGWLRWIWLPYRKLMRHRSFWSHGLLVGTTLRLLYLAVWFAGVALLGAAIVALILGPPWTASAIVGWNQFWQSRTLINWTDQFVAEWVAVFLGLELGAMSHSFSDWTLSAYQQFRKDQKRKAVPNRKTLKKPGSRSRRSKSKAS